MKSIDSYTHREDGYNKPTVSWWFLYIHYVLKAQDQA